MFYRPLTDSDSVDEKLKIPTVVYDTVETARSQADALEALDGILGVRMTG